MERDEWENENNNGNGDECIIDREKEVKEILIWL